MHEIEAALADIRTAWLAGRPALDSAPQAWRDAAGENELVLLALAGHATDVLTRQTSGAALAERPLLPMLSSPLVPEALRARFCRLLATPKNTISLEKPLIRFLAARGYAAHPADWMPGANDEWTPDIYAAWLDWVRAETSAAATESDITTEAYDQWSWSDRRQALEQLRARDPAAALAIIAAKAGSEPAERRLRLIELLHIKLSEADAEYLETLAKDRSDRVQAVSRMFLARLGRGGDTSELAFELAAMLELNKTGLIKRRMQVSLPMLKTGAQITRRHQLLGLVSLAALAQALNATELQLVESVPKGEPTEVQAFIACVADTGTDAAVAALAVLLRDDADSTVALLAPLWPRLSAEQRETLLPIAIKRSADLFESSVTLAQRSLGAVPLATLTASQNYEILRANLEIFTRGEDAGRATATRTLELMLPRLGLLVDSAGARELLTQLTAWGVSPADPKLDMLHFNAALTENAT